MARIEDGTGQGYAARVDKTNRLEVAASVVDEERVAILAGEAWAIGTGLLQFTSANNAAVIYIKNESEADLIVDRFRVMFGTSTGGAGDWLFRIDRNPTGGTIISNASPAGVLNINHGASTTPDGLFYKSSVNPIAGTPDTVTGGQGSQFPIKSTGENQLIIPAGRILPTGSSLALQVQPPAGNTDADINIVTRCYYRPGGM